MRKVTLCFPNDGSHILLGRKQVRFGAGKLNGFGGFVEEGETLLQAAVRETLEECGLEVEESNLEKVAELYFHFEDDSEENHEVHVFFTLLEWKTPRE